MPRLTESSALLATTTHPRREQAAPLLPYILIAPLLLTLPFLLFSHLIHIPPQAPLHPGIAASDPHHLPTPHVPLSFLAIGDWGRKAQHGQRHVADAIANTVSHTLSTFGYNPHYIFSTGDNFYKNGVTSVYDDHFTSSYSNVYNHTVLSNIPWYVILGNHDHIGNIRAQVDFSRINPRWNMPATFFAQRFSDNLVVIFLDTTPFVNTEYGDLARGKNNQSPHAQLRWLKRQLSDTVPSAYFLIVGHHNLYTMSTDGHLGSSELRDAIEPLLAPYRHRILAYISGHEHSLMHLQPYGAHSTGLLEEGPFSPVVDHFISGAGSKVDKIVVPAEDEVEKWRSCCGVLPTSKDPTMSRTVWGKSVHGFFSFRFDGHHFLAEAIDHNGQVIYSYEKTVG